MSAFIVSSTHIDMMVSAALRPQYQSSWYYQHGGERHYVTRETADQTGAMLWLENYRSVNYRYSDSPAEVPPRYTFRLAKERELIEELKAIHCYVYQACEHPAWADSEAKALCEALEWRLTRQLPGYDEAAWGFDSDTPALSVTKAEKDATRAAYARFS